MSGLKLSRDSCEGFQVISIDTEGTAIRLLEQFRRAAHYWLHVGLVVVEFEDGEQEYEIHELCGRDEWRVCERTANNIVLERTS